MAQKTIGSSQWLIDPDEEMRYSLTNGYLINMISKDTMLKEDAVVTNKRLYLCNTTYAGINKKRTELKLDLKDITATRIDNVSRPWLMILTVVALIIGIIMTFAGYTNMSNRHYSGTDASTVFLVGCALIVISIILFISYLTIRDTLFTIQYSGCGSSGIVFNTKKYGLAKVREFQREIHMAKAYVSSNHVTEIL